MQRRSFLKGSLAAATCLLTPTLSQARALDLNTISFDRGRYSANSAQTIVIFMYGGASQLAGNLSNIEEITEKSQSDYSYFRGLSPTARECWQEAGGTHMEALLDAGDMTLFRSCYSEVREANNNKAHGLCVTQNQKGSFDETSAGIVTNLAQILQDQGLIDAESILPFVSLEGDSVFSQEGELPLDAYLKPVSLDEALQNPYERDEREWFYYTPEEQEIDGYDSNTRGFDAPLHAKMDELAQSINHDGKIKEAFSKRVELDAFMKRIATSTLPDLGENAYPNNDRFAEKLETSIKIMVNNPDTKMITVGTGGLGGWDDHNDAREYVSRMESLFRSLRSALAHLKAEGKEGSINIMVFGEFGRNVNLNAAQGWDHGNLQNFYVLGGKNYFSHRGVVGETVVEDTGSINRLYLKPKSGSYSFEPMSIAATIYSIYGVNNPEILCSNNPAVDL